MTTDFEAWTMELAAARGGEALSDAVIGAELGIHRNRVTDYKRGHTTHTPPKPVVLKRRTLLAMAALLAGLEPWNNSFLMWTVELAAARGVERLSDAAIGAELGIHRNRVTDYHRGHTTHTPPQTSIPDRRTLLAMAALLAGIEPWSNPENKTA